MSKKDIEKALDEINELADKALEEAKETKMEVRTWLKEECTFKRSEIIVVGVCVIASLWVLGIT
tara:strand:+ start:225 stop:416 length:192 start_codon:yes stop_codon:yes gene_type:complete